MLLLRLKRPSDEYPRDVTQIRLQHAVRFCPYVCVWSGCSAAVPTEMGKGDGGCAGVLYHLGISAPPAGTTAGRTAAAMARGCTAAFNLALDWDRIRFLP